MCSSRSRRHIDVPHRGTGNTVPPMCRYREHSTTYCAGTENAVSPHTEVQGAQYHPCAGTENAVPPVVYPQALSCSLYPSSSRSHATKPYYNVSSAQRYRKRVQRTRSSVLTGALLFPVPIQQQVSCHEIALCGTAQRYGDCVQSTKYREHSTV
jgi:hypothetical protein